MRSSALFQGYNWRFLRLFVLALLLVTGGGMAFHLSSQLKQHADSMTRYVRVDAWAVQQLEYETHQFRTRFALYVAGDENVTLEDVRKSLTKVKATAPLLKQGRDYRDFRLLIDIDGAAAAVLATLVRVERLLGTVNGLRGNLGTLHLVEESLWAPTNRLRQVAIDLAHVRAELQDGDLENVRWLTDINRWMLAGFGLILILFIGLLISEIRAAKRAERAAGTSEQLTRYVAEHDQLTGLPNRVFFRRCLQDGLAQAQGAGSGLALHVLNLNGFKEINDAFGPSFGDTVLIAAAARVTNAAADWGLVFRLGGDEFAVLQATDAEGADCRVAADAFLVAFDSPFDLDGRQIHVSVNIGFAHFPTDANFGDDLLKSADLALNAAKVTGNCAMPYESSMATVTEGRKELEEDLHSALVNDEFQVFFQPQVTLANRHYIGAEALVRWRHPEFGWISPAKFIPIAEASGLIFPLGRLVLEMACQAAQNWPDYSDSVVAVNVSPLQFMHQDIVQDVKDVLAKTGLPAWRLELEITEGMLMHDQSATAVKINQLRSLGVRFAIDDFGTGYSSLSYLQQFEFQKLKIDRSFVNGIAKARDNRNIIRAVIELGNSLGMTVLAEGIEDREQLDHLAGLGCDEGQGYLFAKPMPEDEFCDWVKIERPRARTPTLSTVR